MILAFDTIAFIADIFKFIIPSLIVFGITYSILTKFMEDQQKARILEIKKQHSSEITPVRLQAYERLTIFLDRISPDNLVLRHSKSGQSAAELRVRLIQSITEEYNHNISQQIFISDQSWELIKAVKEQIIGIIEYCYKQCNPESSGPELGKKILNHLMEQKEVPTQRAIQFLKKELEIVM